MFQWFTSHWDVIPILMISNHFHPQRAVKLEPRTATKDIRQQELICWANLKTEKEYEDRESTVRLINISIDYC